MSTKVVGDTAYELIYKDDLPLTDTQAEALVAEYAKLGLRYKKCTRNGHNCVIAKAPAAEYEAFCEKKAKHWESIQERVGYSGCLCAKNNTYQPGTTSFSPGPDWNDVVAFIEANFSSSKVKSGERKWWEFWK